jgi:HSP20 family protein
MGGMKMRMLGPLSDWSMPRRTLTPSFWTDDVFDDFDRVINSFVQPAYTHNEGFKPSCDIEETKDHYLVSFDIPGVKKDDIQIEVEGNSLVVSGERQQFKTKTSETSIRNERTYGKFERVFELPQTIDASKIEAHYESGVLSIMLPKAEVHKARKVEIQTGEEGFFKKLLGVRKESPKELGDGKNS